LINKKRTPATEKRKLPTATKTPRATAQTNNSIAKIEKSEKTKNEKNANEKATTKNEVTKEAPKDFIPETESIESTASKDTKDTATIPTIPTNANEPVKFLSPKDLVPKLGINDKMIRIFLRKNYPRPEKGKQWEITPEFAKRIVKDYAAKSKADKAEKTEQIQEQLTAK
jgi:hypothetical protein